MLADLDEFLNAAAAFMELKHCLLEALLDGRPIAVDYAQSLQEYSAKFDMFCRLNSIAILYTPVNRIPCPECHRAGRGTSLLSEIELRPAVVEFWSALYAQKLQLYLKVGRCEECGGLLIAADKDTIRRLFSGFGGDRWWFINAEAQPGTDAIVVKNWGKANERK
ncbi:MAG: hypothetical protein DRP82_02715 [Planctomycetota bacterium]|nr:MAG: hypothetical protein DRP82_02715 [Planctomycetota bacterium]